MRLMSLSQIGDPDVLILAAAAGDVGTMRTFLQTAPDKVSIYNTYMTLCACMFFVGALPTLVGGVGLQL